VFEIRITMYFFWQYKKQNNKKYKQNQLLIYDLFTSDMYSF